MHPQVLWAVFAFARAFSTKCGICAKLLKSAAPTFANARLKRLVSADAFLFACKMLFAFQILTKFFYHFFISLFLYFFHFFIFFYFNIFSLFVAFFSKSSKISNFSFLYFYLLLKNYSQVFFCFYSN